eukprot:1675964-Pleurochrysis_carterae.AAC.2
MVTQYVADCAQREREVAEACEHGELDVEQNPCAFADGPYCVCEFVGHQAVCEAIGCRQRSVQPVKLLVKVVERAERWFIHSFNLQRAHHRFDRGGH